MEAVEVHGTSKKASLQLFLSCTSQTFRKTVKGLFSR